MPTAYAPPLGSAFLSLAGHGVPLQADIAVGDMMKKDQERFPERREELLNMLGVDPNWRMHQVRAVFGATFEALLLCWDV